MEMESIEVSVETEREFTRRLERLRVLVTAPQTPLLHTRVAVSYMLGVQHIRFSTLWPMATGVITAASESKFNLIWPLLSAAIEQADILDWNSPSTLPVLVDDDDVKPSGEEIWAHVVAS